MKIKLLITVLFCLLLTGCFSTGDKIVEKEKQFASIKGDLDERSRQLTAGVVDTIESKKEENRSVEENVALILASEDLRIEGSPIERIDVIKIIEQYKQEKEELLSDFQKYKDENTYLLKDKRKISEELVALRNQLERENNRSIFSRIKGWFFGLGGGTIVLVIIGCIFFPAPMFAFLSFIIKKIIQIFPKLINFVGIVGKEVVYNIVEGVEHIKKEINNAPDDKLYNKKEVYELIQRNFKQSEKTHHHNKTVDTIKGHLKSKGKI